MRFLVIGISNLIMIILIISCSKGDVEYKNTTNFIYKNNSVESIMLQLFNSNNNNFKNYIVEPQKELIISTTLEGSPNGLNQPFAFNSNSNNVAIKVILKFNNSDKCKTYTEGEGVLFLKAYDNFSLDMYNSTNNTLIYIIDNQELNEAITCN